MSKIALLILAAGTLAATPVWGCEAVSPLEPGPPLEREMRSGERHCYEIAARPGQYLDVAVEQLGIDVALTLRGAEGETLEEVDGPSGATGIEPLGIVTAEGGRLRLEVGAPATGQLSGRYSLELRALRDAQPGDGDRAAAAQAYADAARRGVSGTAEAVASGGNAYREAVRLWRSLGDERLEAQALHSLGMSLSWIGQYAEALDAFEESLEIRRRNHDAEGELATLSQIGATQAHLGLRLQALQTLTEALEQARALGNRERQAFLLTSLGLVEDDLGETQHAIDAFEAALPIAMEIGDKQGQSVTLGGIAANLWALGDPESSLAYFDRAILLAREQGDRRAECNLLSDLGNVQTLLGNYAIARGLLEQSLGISRGQGDTAGEAKVLDYQGMLAFRENRWEDAEQAYRGVLALSKSVRGQARGYLGLGHSLLARGAGEEAREPLEKAIDLFRQWGDRSEEASALMGLARLSRQQGRLEEARDLASQAVRLAEEHRTHLGRQDLRTSFLERRQGLYERYLGFLMELDRHDPAKGYRAEALGVVELIRARSLLDTLTAARMGNIRRGIDPALLEREEILTRQVNDAEYRRLLLQRRKAPEDKVQAARQEAEDRLAELHRIRSEIQAKSPAYAALTQPRPLTLEEIRREVLDDDTLLLEFSLGAEQSFVWAVTRREIAAYPLPARSTIEPLARRVYDLLSQSHLRMARGPARMEAAALSEVVLRPVARHFGKPRVLIVADDVLHYIPFAALPIPGKGDGELLGERYEIASAPSSSSLAALRATLADRPRTPGSVAILADPVFSATDPRLPAIRRNAAAKASGTALERSTADLGLDSIERLPFSRSEAEAIAALVGSDPLLALDFRASRETATSPELARYRILHLATHGFLNPLHPELSGLVFSLVDEEGRSRDGFLRAHEVYNLELPADLVVLSACQTALGREVRGEGLVGLTRGFLYAGAASVLASLWKVDDPASAELMRRFYRGLLHEGLSPTAALRAAQRELRKNPRWEAPYYWAGWVLQGDWRQQSRTGD